MSRQKLVEAFAQAIATMEGFYARGATRAKVNNNPGNLRSWGSVPLVAGYASFPTASDGWNALRQQVHKNLFTRKLTIGEFFGGKDGVYPGYAPSADKNDPGGYANFVCHFLNPKFPDDQPFWPSTVLAALPFEADAPTAPAPTAPTTAHPPR